MSGQGFKKLEQNVWSMTVIRIGTDANDVPFVDVRITETGEERQLYVGDSLNMILDLKDEFLSER